MKMLVGTAILMLTLSACGSKAIQPDVNNTVHTIAILPFVNQTNNISAPYKIRTLLREKIEFRRYKVLPMVEVDRALADKFNVTLGEHLQDISFVDLGEELQVDAFIYGEITHFDQTISGALNANRVSAVLRMVSSKDENDIIWQSRIGIKNQYSTNSLGTRLINESDKQDRKSSILWVDISDMNNKHVGGNNNNILQGLVAGLISRNSEIITDTTLAREIEVFINHSVDNMPAGPGD